ncbi:TetR/AcrR family transcriptional regulator [Myceligenerans crystallogenes]|uniref:HTH tetR-type domain-containing protein n=1 Tax=Myceligenerans crystallogenes TaxID=316335 RepID=A0ABN2NIV9_9MICO
MPRLADHGRRRRQITDAARRVVARDGLAAATFQTVAAEAGISVRLVQYYFGTKREFLLATHRAVAEDAGTRLAARLAALGESPPRAVVRGILAELLPADDARRQDAVVLDAFHSAALTGSEVAAADTIGAPRVIVDLVAGQLRRIEGASRGTSSADDDAWLLVLAAAGLAQAMLVDPPTAERAGDLLDRLLDRFVGGASGR